MTIIYEQIERAAKALAKCMDYPWEHMPEKGRAEMRKHALTVIEAGLQPIADVQAEASEREAFEAWIKKDGGDLSTFGTGPNVHYHNSAVNNAWGGWKTRATVAHRQRRLYANSP